MRSIVPPSIDTCKEVLNKAQERIRCTFCITLSATAKRQLTDVLTTIPDSKGAAVGFKRLHNMGDSNNTATIGFSPARELEHTCRRDIIIGIAGVFPIQRQHSRQIGYVGVMRNVYDQLRLVQLRIGMLIGQHFTHRSQQKPSIDRGNLRLTVHEIECRHVYA